MIAARNAAIILAAAAVFTFLPGGGDAARIIDRTISVAFIAVLVWGVSLLRRRFALDLETLAVGYRALLYGGVGAIVLALAGASRMTDTGIGTLALVAILAAAMMALVLAVRELRSYS
ncbi:unannotated protein [freshwater metagenome]|uniref:Unannotated protein n=1 Tax=freshwater metagenome TaxID=449393 RepID=A0A6J7HIE6_9ZZZZ|nr:hypothetical protein [Actinomycetota bacterium]